MNKKPRPAPETLTGHWGIFGGMFDPVHHGHVTMAVDICHAEHLVGLILVPGVQPPHRPDRPRAGFDHRCAMLTLAFAHVTRTVISDIESRLDELHYTLNVVRALKSEFPAARLTFLIGADQVENFSSWHRPDDILKEIDIVAGTRPGYRAGGSDVIAGEIKFIPTHPVDVSSTRVRAAVREGWSADQLAQLVPAPVAHYIVQHRLYQ